MADNTSLGTERNISVARVGCSHHELSNKSLTTVGNPVPGKCPRWTSPDLVSTHLLQLGCDIGICRVYTLCVGWDSVVGESEKLVCALLSEGLVDHELVCINVQTARANTSVNGKPCFVTNGGHQDGLVDARELRSWGKGSSDK